MKGKNHDRLFRNAGGLSFVDPIGFYGLCGMGSSPSKGKK
jgi:hypothetical protein